MRLMTRDAVNLVEVSPLQSINIVLKHVDFILKNFS